MFRSDLWSDRAVDSLFDISAASVASNADHYLSDIVALPGDIKSKLLWIMTRRGTVTDHNISQLLHPEIKTMDLQHCQVSDSALLQLQCPQLGSINLNGCQSITSEGVRALASCPQLQEVDLTGCTGVTDEGVLALAHGCGFLRVLSLRGCSAVGDAGVLGLAGSCSHLKSLDLSETQVTDVGACGIATGICSNNLKELSLVRCLNLTDKTVTTVLTHCPNMELFHFHGCPHIKGLFMEAQSNYVSPAKIQQVFWTIY